MRKIFFLLLISGSVSSCSLDEELRGIWLINEGAEEIYKENPGKAQQDFTEALAMLPFEGIVHNNLGVALDHNKDIEKAIKAYEAAHEYADQPQEKFSARYNLGQAYAKQGKINEALDWYQQALEIKPDSKETKTNIELLLKTSSNKGQGQGQGKNEGESNQDSNGEGQDKKDKQDKEYKKNQKYKPREFKGDLSENDVRKILGELKQQEQRIRADYNKKDAKEAPRDKDW